jgi:uncharacterized protein (DUF2336 family)
MAATPSLIPELDDVSPERRTEAVKRIATLFVESADRFSDEHVKLFDGVFAQLISDIEAKAKAELAQRLAPVTNAPATLMRTLAGDDDISVAGPVLQRSVRLGEKDLVDVARSKSQAHLLAISGRGDIGMAVTEVLVRRGDREVVRKVASNKRAVFSESTFARLVQQAGKDGVLAEKVGLRSDVPQHLFHDLVAQATELVQKRLLAAANPQTRSEIRNVLAKVSGEIAQAGPSRDYGAAQQAVAAMQRAGRLDEEAIAAFCRAGQFEHTVAALAALTPLSIEIADRLMADERTDPVLILCKALGFAWPTVRGIVVVRPAGKVMAPQSIDAAASNFERLAPATAQRVVRFWQLRDGQAAP